MTIKTGDRLPSASFKQLTSTGVVEVGTDALLKGKKAALFGLPGASRRSVWPVTCPAASKTSASYGLPDSTPSLASRSTTRPVRDGRLGQGPWRRRQGDDARERRCDLHEGHRHGCRPARFQSAGPLTVLLDDRRGRRRQAARRREKRARPRWHQRHLHARVVVLMVVTHRPRRWLQRASLSSRGIGPGDATTTRYRAPPRLRPLGVRGCSTAASQIAGRSTAVGGSCLR